MLPMDNTEKSYAKQRLAVRKRFNILQEKGLDPFSKEYEQDEKDIGK